MMLSCVILKLVSGNLARCDNIAPLGTTGHRHIATYRQHNILIIQKGYWERMLGGSLEVFVQLSCGRDEEHHEREEGR